MPYIIQNIIILLLYKLYTSMYMYKVTQYESFAVHAIICSTYCSMFYTLFRKGVGLINFLLAPCMLRQFIFPTCPIKGAEALGIIYY